MRPIDEESQRTLAVIDQTLAGEAVAPQDADLAELTLILAGQRPQPSAAFAASLDDRVSQRFAAAPARPSGQRARRARRSWLYAPGAAFAAAATAAAVVIVVSGGTPPRQLSTDLSATAAQSAPAIDNGAATASSSSATSTTAAAAAPTRAPSPAPATAAAGSASSSAAGSVSGSATGSASSSAAGLSPLVLDSGQANRKVIRSAQISLATRPSQVDSVAQQVFTVVGNENGVVNSSNVTATNDATGYAQFQLSVPSANLGATMAALSRLHGAAVVSRTDNSQDVTGRTGGAGQRLADARALRTALLRELAIATTTTAIDSLKVQIRDANASIASDLATLRALQRQVATSQISLTINASMIAGHHPANAGGSAFTLRRAAHDAGRVLVVVAGVALIALAVLVPLGLIAAIGAWFGFAVRRRRREQALDLI
ncbi:MAG TPA: DUF4349 domain-containing protein [Solirubrobacteraceae bacterium]